MKRRIGSDSGADPRVNPLDLAKDSSLAADDVAVPDSKSISILFGVLENDLSVLVQDPALRSDLLPQPPMLPVDTLDADPFLR